MFYSKTTNKIWLEANTERSESNPGRSLGVNMIYKTAVWKTVPWWRAHSPLARSPGSKSITDNADATDLFFHGFLLCCWISLRLRGAGIVTDYLLQEEPCAVQAQIQSERNPLQYTRPNKRNPWKDKIRRIGVISELFERVRTEPKAKEYNNVVLSSRQLSSP